MPGGSLGAVIAPTYRMLMDSTITTFLDLARTGNVLRAFSKSEMTAELVNNTRVLFRSGDEPDRLRGTNLSWAFMDEGALCNEDVFLILLARLREPPAKLWICSTPRGRDHWLFERFIRSESHDYEVIKSSTRDNPFLPSGFVQRLEAQYTSVWQQQEIDGLFVEIAGSLFKRSWFRVIEHAPEGLRWSRYWDLASSTREQADFSASARVALSKESGDVFISDMIKLKQEWPLVRRTIIATAVAEPGTLVGVESAVHGLAAFQELMREPKLVGTSLRSIRVDKDKVSRALPVASRAEQGLVKLVRGSWIAGFLDEATAFPNGSHDDQIDSISGAFGMLKEPRKILYA